VLVRLLTSIMPKVLLPSTDQFGRIFSAQVWNWCSVCAVTSQRQSCPSADLFIPQEYDPHHALDSRVAGCRTGRHSSDRNLQCILFVLGCLLYEWVNDKQHLLWLYVCILEGEPLVYAIAFCHSYWWKERKSLRLYDCLYVVNWLYDRSWLHGCFVLMFSVKRQIKRAWIISC
jgi:hypothetical protein